MDCLKKASRQKDNEGVRLRSSSFSGKRSPSPYMEDVFNYLKFDLAVEQGNTEEVFRQLQLLNDPYVLNFQNKYGETALHVAVRVRQVRILRMLFCAGANSRITDYNGDTPLQTAVASGSLPCVEALTTRVKDCEIEAAGLRYFPFIASPIPDHYNREGLTSVHQAFYEGHIDILKHLIEKVNANINARELTECDTCLHIACLSGNESLVVALLDLGATNDVVNRRKLTPYGMGRIHPRIIQILEERGFKDFSENKTESARRVDVEPVRPVRQEEEEEEEFYVAEYRVVDDRQDYDDSQESPRRP